MADSPSKWDWRNWKTVNWVLHITACMLIGVAVTAGGIALLTYVTSSKNTDDVQAATNDAGLALDEQHKAWDGLFLFSMAAYVALWVFALIMIFVVFKLEKEARKFGVKFYMTDSDDQKTMTCEVADGKWSSSMRAARLWYIFFAAFSGVFMIMIFTSWVFGLIAIINIDDKETFASGARSYYLTQLVSTTAGFVAATIQFCLYVARAVMISSPKVCGSMSVVDKTVSIASRVGNAGRQFYRRANKEF